MTRRQDNFDLYLTRLALVPLCLHTLHSVRTSTGFFFLSAPSGSLLTGRRPRFGAASESDDSLGFCVTQTKGINT